MLFNLELLGQVLVLLPLDFGADGTVIDKVASVSHLLLIEVCFVQYLILKVLVRAEMKADLETWLGFVVGKVREPNVNKMFESSRVAISDEV